LGFSLKLIEFRHEMNPGMMGDASFASSVRVIDKANNVDTPAEIAMNQPLVYGRFGLLPIELRCVARRQAGVDSQVTYDPGIFLKYLGCYMTCFGVFVVFYGKSFSFLTAPLARRRRTNRLRERFHTEGRIALLALTILAAGAASALAARKTPLPSIGANGIVAGAEGGRQKPLDTLARETLRTMSNRSSLSDPQTQQELDPTALYLTLLFTGQGWDRPASPHGTPAAEGCPGQPAKHQPDAWDREPLLLIDSAALRTALGCRPDRSTSRSSISPDDDRGSEDRRKEPFRRLGANTPSRRAAKPNGLQRKGLELAERYLGVPRRASRAEA